VNEAGKKIGKFRFILGYLKGFAISNFWKKAHQIRVYLPSPKFLSLLELKIGLRRANLFNLERKSPETNYPTHDSSEKNMFAREVIIGMPKYMEQAGKLAEWNYSWIFANSFDSEQRVNYAEEIPQDSLASELDSTEIQSYSFESVLILNGLPLKDLDSITRNLYEEHRNNSRKKIIVILGDYRKTRGPGMINEWINDVDLIVHFNPLVNPSEFGKNGNRLFLWPNPPWPEKILRSLMFEQKEPCLVFTGSLYRGRDTYFNFCKRKGIRTINLSHSLDQDNFFSTVHEYLREFSRFQLTFSNGYLYHNESLMVGKVQEAIILGTTVLYESGSWIDQFLIPYRHYVPIRNRSDLRYKSEYLLKHLEVAKYISHSAFEYHSAHYSSKRFWQLVQRRLEILDERENLL
jgi:hypothetical protein